MATSVDYIEFVCEQVRGAIRGAGDIRYKKMFGEYMVYVNDKPILLVCDNTVYIKMLPELEELMEQAETGCPYEGAKEHYILDVEETELSRATIDILVEKTPVPKPRKRSTKH